MEKWYWLNGVDWVKLLGAKGFSWDCGKYYCGEKKILGSGKNIQEKVMEKGYSYVPVVDYEKKTVSIFPLEIYAPNSPTRNDEKFKYYTSKCGDWDDFMKDLRELT